MLTIERPSPISNKLVIAAIVFSVGFMGSLSVLRIWEPGSGRLSSSRENGTVSVSEATDGDREQGDKESGDAKNRDSGEADVASGAPGEVRPVASASVDQPVSAYSDPSTVNTTRQTPASSAVSSVPTARIPSSSSDESGTQPSTSSPPSTTTLLDPQPLTKTTDNVADTAGNLLPSLSTCSCDN